MTSDQRVRTPMFVDEPGTGLVLTGLRRYNLFTSLFFLGRQRRLLAELADRSGVRPGQAALDIGCGPGKLVRALGRRAGSAGSVTGADPSAEAIAYNEHRDPRNRYVLSTAQELALPDTAFDVVTCTFVMHHLPEQQREAALRQMWRVLRPGGRLLLADAHPSPLITRVFAFSDRLRRKEPTDHWSFSDIRRYRSLLHDIGFADTEFVVTPYNTGILLAAKPPL